MQYLPISIEQLCYAAVEIRMLGVPRCGIRQRKAAFRRFFRGSWRLTSVSPALLQSRTRSAAAFSGASTVSCTAASVSVGVYTKRSLTRLCGEVSSQTSRYRPP